MGVFRGLSGRVPARQGRATCGVAIVVAVIGAFIVPAGAADAEAPTTFYVAPGGSGNACTQADPCSTIGQALTDAWNVAGPVVVDVATGIYPEAVAIGQGTWSSLTLTGTQATITGTSSSNIVLTSDATTVTVEGFTIEPSGGFADVGVDVQGGTLALFGNVITGANQGGLVISDGTVNSNGDTISNSGTDYGSGGVSISAGQLTLTGDTITGNVPGGVQINGGEATLSGNTIDHNGDGTYAGAGLYSQTSGTVTVAESTISDNAGTDGGGIAAVAGTIDLTDTTVSANTANAIGGIWFDAASGTLDRDLVSSNQAANNAAGIQLQGNPPSRPATYSVVDTTVTGNQIVAGGTGGAGGILALDVSALSLTHDTIASNTGTGGAGALSVQTDGLPNPVVAASIVAGGCYTNGEITDGGYNVESDKAGSCDLTGPTSLVGKNPELKSLADNGGPTDTMAITATSPAHHLIPSTTEYCTGNNALPNADERGVSWIRGRAKQCDAGAYQATPPQLYKLAPTSGPAGTTVTVTGYDFTDPLVPHGPRTVTAVRVG